MACIYPVLSNRIVEHVLASKNVIHRLTFRRSILTVSLAIASFLLCFIQNKYCHMFQAN